jgi:hypothetical protein
MSNELLILNKVKVTNFAKRHFDPKFGGTKITSHTAEEFELAIRTGHAQAYHKNPHCVFTSVNSSYRTIYDGYADFCKIWTVLNFTNAKTGTMPITLENYQYLRSGYGSRRDEELAVLSRWFELPIPAPYAEWLQIVVYSREQLLKEHEESGFDEKFELSEDDEWGVVAILAQNDIEPEPMKPATMLRNALGTEYGGSGVALDPEEYNKSVEFWKTHATVK